MQEKKVIGGVRYGMEPLGGLTGQLVLLRLARPWALILEAAAAKGIDNASLEQLVSSGGLSKALGAISDADLTFITEKLAEKTTLFVPDGKVVREWPLASQYDSHFAGRYQEMLEWLLWGIKLNRLFVRAPSRASEAAGASASESPTASTGGGGDSSSPAIA
jgi:hypothetical protein